MQIIKHYFNISEISHGFGIAQIFREAGKGEKEIFTEPAAKAVERVTGIIAIASPIAISAFSFSGCSFTLLGKDNEYFYYGVIDR